MTGFTDDRMAELREIFFESSQEILQTLNETALQFEKQPQDLEALRSMRRAVHTLKGDAAACGFREISTLAHEFEDLLAHENLAQNKILVEAALTAADLFAAMIAALRQGKRTPSPETLRKILKRVGESSTKALSKPNPRAKKLSGPHSRSRRKTACLQAPADSVADKVVPWTEYERLAIQQAQAQKKRVYHLKLTLDPQCAMPEAALQMVRSLLAKSGDLLALYPADGPTLGRKRRLQIALASAEDPAALSAKSRIPSIIAEASVRSLPEPAEDTATKTHSPAADETPSLDRSAEPWLRVDAERIDSVLDLVGELILGRSMQQQVISEFAARFPKDPLRVRLLDVFSFQSRVLNELQRSVTKIRMVPVSQLFRRFPRVVRDTAKECNREVELHLSGQDTELDKSILDALAEPLAHLVRNAISHGLEDPEERARAGKPAIGAIRLSAYHQGHQVVLELSDDGRGINEQRIRERAVELGLIGQAEASRLDQNSLLKFIFMPGFSTASTVTAVSGRGVGLDVVQAVLQRLKGSVTVESQPGTGTTFRLRLPLTLAIIKAILFRVAERIYAVPLNSVVEMLRTNESAIHCVEGREVMQRRNEVLTLVRAGQTRSSVAGGKLFILVVSIGGQKLGLIVDELVGQEELVIKPLDAQVVASELVSGVSILGNGKVVLILNLRALMQSLQARTREPGHSPWGFLLLKPEERLSRSAPAGGAQ